MANSLRSTTGCLTCRRRRVKCDESRPSCKRCQKASIQCAWSGQAPAHQYLSPSTIIGNTYSALYLRSEFCDFVTRDESATYLMCPAKALSSGYVPFRDQGEHDSFVKLSKFLSMLESPHKKDTEPGFEFRVALQEIWVRNAMLAMAATVLSTNKAAVYIDVHPHYESASKAVRYQVTQELTEGRLEQLLIASLFLGIIEMANPDNSVFPLLHFEAVGRILQFLHDKQNQRELSKEIALFHRKALESYLYHMSIQSLYYPQIDRFPTLSPLVGSMTETMEIQVSRNTIIAMDMRIYITLFELTRLSRQDKLSDDDRHRLSEIHERIGELQEDAHELLNVSNDSDSQHEKSFYRLTDTAASVLAIFCMKVSDRKLVSRSETLRRPLQLALSKLESCEPSRMWTGNFGWMFTILTCAISTVEESMRLTQKLQQLSSGFWGADTRRMKHVLRATRKYQAKVGSGGQEIDPLDMLVEGRLSMIPGQASCMDDQGSLG